MVVSRIFEVTVITELVSINDPNYAFGIKMELFI